MRKINQRVFEVITISFFVLNMMFFAILGYEFGYDQDATISQSVGLTGVASALAILVTTLSIIAIFFYVSVIARGVALIGAALFCIFRAYNVYFTLGPNTGLWMWLMLLTHYSLLFVLNYNTRHLTRHAANSSAYFRSGRSE